MTDEKDWKKKTESKTTGSRKTGSGKRASEKTESESFGCIIIIKFIQGIYNTTVHKWSTRTKFLNLTCSHLTSDPKPFRGVIWPESSPHVFLLPKTLNLKKKSGGHLSVVAFGSERLLSENIYTF